MRNGRIKLMKVIIKRASGTLFVLALLVLPFIAWTQRWYIYDSLRLRNYKPPTEVVQLATDTTLNQQTRRLFYVYYPSLEDKSNFNNNCKTGEKTIVLGCYVSGQGIFLYKITDARLNGIIQVTAAHETLHAAYDRLNADEKSRIDILTQKVYKSTNNPRINEAVSDYQKNGADVANELHSIIGTEVRDLPPELEAYYAKYFTNRIKIVEFSEKYEQEFTNRKQLVLQYDASLNNLKNQIDNKENGIESMSSSLQSERARLDGLLEAKDYENYNQAVPKYNSRISTFNNQVREVRSLIEQYNKLVVKRNAIVSEETELIKAIDSRPDTLPTQ